MLQQVSETGAGSGEALVGQDHVEGPATLGITAVDPLLPGLHQELNSTQLAIKARHVERRQTLEDNFLLLALPFNFCFYFLNLLLK